MSRADGFHKPVIRPFRMGQGVMVNLGQGCGQFRNIG